MQRHGRLFLCCERFSQKMWEDRHKRLHDPVRKTVARWGGGGKHWKLKTMLHYNRGHFDHLLARRLKEKMEVTARVTGAEKDSRGEVKQHGCERGQQQMTTYLKWLKKGEDSARSRIISRGEDVVGVSTATFKESVTTASVFSGLVWWESRPQPSRNWICFSALERRPMDTWKSTTSLYLSNGSSAERPAFNPNVAQKFSLSARWRHARLRWHQWQVIQRSERRCGSSNLQR